MRLWRLAVPVLALSPGIAMAGNDKVTTGPVPGWVSPSELLPLPAEPSGPIFVRREDTLIHVDGRGQAQYQGYRIRILHPNALQLGNLTLTWNPAAGAPVVHSIRIHRDGQVIDVLANAKFEVLRREDQLEAAMLTGVLTAVMRVPDLRVGDELEFEATTSGSDPTLGDHASGALALFPSPAPGRFHLGLSWAESRHPDLRVSADLEKLVVRGERQVDLKIDNPPALQPAKDAPPRYHWQRVIEYSDYANWATISRQFADLFTQAARLSAKSPLRAEAARIAAANPGAPERMAAALKLVQQDVRYVFVGLGNGNLTPASADETWQRRYGDCKAKTAMLLALLGELGIEAEAVLANNAGNDDGFDARLPNPLLFDHVLVRAQIGGRAFYLDGTLPPVALPAAEPVLPYRWLLPLTAAGSGLERQAWHPATRPDEVTLFDLDARAGFDKPARITMTVIQHGIQGLMQQVQFSAVTPEQLSDAMRQQMVGDTWQVVDQVKWHYDQKAQASVMTVSGTGTLDWEVERRTRSLALPGGGFSPPERRIRSSAQPSDVPFYQQPEYNCHATTLRMPSGTKPGQWSFNQGYTQHYFGRTYFRAFEMRDGTIRMVRGSRIEQTEVDSASAEKDNARIPKFENSKGLVYFDPEIGGPPANSGKVPAVDEIDWAGDNVPCLAVDKPAKG